jgi:hypothetical protein
LILRGNSVLKLIERLEIVGITESNRGAMVTVAPAHVVAILYPTHTWVVTVLVSSNLWIVTYKNDGIGTELPIHPILAFATVDVHLTLSIVNAEDSGKRVPERHNCAVEDAIGARN